MEARTPRLALSFVLGLALSVGGCGSKTETPPKQVKSVAPVRTAASAADGLSPNLVGAVTTTKNGAALLQVKFELAARPEVGEPVDVDLVIVPQADNIDRITGTIQADDGVEVLSGGDISTTEKLAFGTPIHHALKVRAKRDGIFTLSAALTIEQAGQTLGPAYSMPLIAGNGLADTGAAGAPAKSPPKPAPRTAAK
jgi:hypothetical protein